MREMFVAVAVVSLTSIVAVPGVLSAQPGNAGAAYLCQQGGYLSLHTSDGQPFANAGACVGYAARGGEFFSGADLSVTVDDPTAAQLTVRVRNDGLLDTSATVRFTSLEPGNATGPFLQGYDLPTGWSCVFTGPCDVNFCANCSTSSFAAGAEAVFQPQLHRGWEVEVTAAGEPDPDSTPDNQDPDEDDYVLIPFEF